VNNSVQKLVGGVIRVVLGFPPGTSHQSDAAPAMYRIYNREKSFFDLRLGYGPKTEQNFIFYFLKIVRSFRQDIIKVGSRNVPRP
jgi:hypothetical protein